MSRRRRTAIIVLCILIAAVLLRLDHTLLQHRRQTTPEKNSPQNTEKHQESISRDFARYHKKIFRVINIVDGDTIDINVPDGKDRTTRIRLWGVDTPETKNNKTGVMYFGPESSEFTTKLSLGKPVRIYLEKHRTRGKYGRLLAYVQLPDERFLNELLVSEGFAYADLRFQHSLYHKYSQLQNLARSSGKGLWENVKRSQLPQWLQRRNPQLLKTSKD